MLKVLPGHPWELVPDLIDRRICCKRFTDPVDHKFSRNRRIKSIRQTDCKGGNEGRPHINAIKNNLCIT